jgi:hypothetical protein
MTTSDNSSILGAIAALQRRAYLRAGFDIEALSEYFADLKKRMVLFQNANPSYLPERDDVLRKDPDLSFLEFDFGRRFDTPNPIPFQNPWSFAILKDYWEYHRRKLYAEGHWQVHLATAPTGNYNATAIAGSSEYGILIEDGLLHLALRACRAVAPLLYGRAGAGFRPRNPPLAQTEADHVAVDELADAVFQYLNGASVVPPPPVLDPEDDFSIRHVLFSGFLAFVLEHELYHLRKQRTGDNQEEFDLAFAPVWKFFDEKLRNHLPQIPTEPELRALFQSHREELWADTVAVSRVMLLGKLEGTLGPSLGGALLFHYLAEAIRKAELLRDDPDALAAESSATEEALVAQALYLHESHPYPQSRRLGVYSFLTRTAPHYKEFLDFEFSRIGPIFELLDERVRERLAPPTSPLIELK